MTMKTYPRSVQRPFNSSYSLPAIIGGFPNQTDDAIEKSPQLLADLSTEQNVPLTPLVNTDAQIPITWNTLRSLV